MKKIILILMFITSAVFADDYQFVVENSTMVDVYFNLFNAIGAMFRNDGYVEMLRFVFLVGGFFVFAGGILKGWEGNSSASIAAYGKYLAAGVAVLTMVFSSTSTLWITTNNLPTFCSDSSPTTGTAVEVPSILAFSFTAINKGGRYLTQMSESAFTQPTDVSAGTASMTDSGGYAASLKKTIKVLSLDGNELSNSATLLNGDKFDFNSYWGNFISQCMIENVQNQGAEGEAKLTEYKNSTNIVEFMRNFLDYTFPNNSIAIGERLIEHNGQTTTCRTYFSLIETATNKLAADSVCTLDLNGGTLDLMGGGTGGANIKSDMTDIVIQSGIIAANAKSKSISATGINTDYAAGKSIAERTMESNATASYMAEMLPYIQMTMRAILYAFFPLCFVVMLLPNGMNVLKQYAHTLLWIELWSPTAAIVNMFVNIKAKEQIGEHISTQGLSLMNSANLLSDASIISGIAAGLYLSIPALTWLILKGSAQMMGNVFAGVAGKFSQNLSTDAMAKDMAQQSVKKESGKSISDTINMIEQSNATNHAAQAYGFDAVGGNKNLKLLSTQSEGKYTKDLETVASQGSNYIDNQKTLGNKTGASETGVAAGYNAGGGFDVESNKNYIETKTGLDTTTKNIADAGSKDAVVDIQSSMNNKEFNKTMEVNANTSKNDFKSKGTIEASEMKAGTDVLKDKGAGAFYDAKVQADSARLGLATSKKAIAGSNLAAALVDEKKGESDFKTAKKTFDKYSTDRTSNVDFEKRKEDITKTETTVASVKDKGYNDTEDFYSNEAKIGSEDRLANIAKADINNDKKIDASEQKEYGSDMTTKAISEQNALKEKNAMLKENGQKMMNSTNKDVREAANRGANKYSAYGEDGLAAGGAGAQSAVATKEQRFTSDEKSEYVDNMENSNISGVDKAQTQAQKDAEDIRKTNVETENFLPISNEQNKLDKYIDVKDNFKRQGLNEIQAQNAALFAFAAKNKMNGEFTEQVFTNNVKSIKKERDEKMVEEAYKNGFIATNDKTLGTQSKAALERRKENIETTLKAFDKLRNDRGQLTPELQMSAQPLILERDKINQTLQNINGLEEFRKSEAGQAIAQESIGKLDNLVHNMQEMKLAKVDDNGNLSFGTSFEGVNAKDLTIDQKIALRQEKGDLGGQKISAIGADGRSYEIITDLSGRRITNFNSAKNGYSNTSVSNNDITYNIQQTDFGKEHMKGIANVNTGINATKNVIGLVGAGKFLLK